MHENDVQQEAWSGGDIEMSRGSAVVSIAWRGRYEEDLCRDCGMRGLGGVEGRIGRKTGGLQARDGYVDAHGGFGGSDGMED